MRRLGPTFAVTVLLLVAAGCGSGSRQLQSISVSPATADAQDFANGQVQFVASGRYNQAPITMSPLPVLWVIHLPGGASGATITQGGVAQCGQGVSSTFSVLAYAPADPNIPIAQLAMAKKAVIGTAVLICP
ncbi:MAG: hypothetical protein LAO03_07015 [Acidobacteriia bacterium]|nr:hypothetical protein [Terriglobia bacterium]